MRFHFMVIDRYEGLMFESEVKTLPVDVPKSATEVANVLKTFVEDEEVVNDLVINRKVFEHEMIVDGEESITILSWRHQ